ncbi:iron chelate uptake ABC transporter family permease subunit [uncultured Desulfuromusa sp.]|uniref:FecCD family ABC transporter permease n=1 Tax=uncultured Desulfuromusa sp. TaxID=219183 RepID=UPI002AA77C19|nr:iron chelate uptake ABC transporter family permease subunit [uncultured Desulfuromusa sp.]
MSVTSQRCSAIIPYLISSLAFAGALATTTCIALLATIYRVNREMIILAGVALSAFFMAGTTILQYFADETQLASIVSWTFGDVGRASWSELKIMVLIVGSGLLFIYRQTMKFNALLAGTDAAGALGVSVVRLRLLSITVAALMTAIIVDILWSDQFCWFGGSTYGTHHRGVKKQRSCCRCLLFWERYCCWVPT